MKNDKVRFVPVRLLGVVLAASVLLVGCGGQSATQLVESGKARMQKKEYKAASIEFKNALQKDSSLVEARFLLGKALLESGDPQGAWVELSKAREAGYSNDELVPPMAATLILRGQVDKFVSEYADVELTVPKRQAELKAALATAYGAQGKYALARTAADAALQADPNNVVAQLAVARLLLISGDKAGALAQIEQARKAQPDSASPWLARAETLQLSGADTAEVMAAYHETLKREPTNLQAHIAIFSLLSKQRDLAGMDQQLADLKKAVPGTPYINYFGATLALERKDLKTALENAQQLLKMAPDSPRFLHLAGVIEYERGAYQQAAAHLGKAVSVGPLSPVATRTLLARSLLRAGDPRKALTAVQPLLDAKTPLPADVYSVAADVYLQLGNGEAAKKMYASAVKANPGDARGRTALALAEISEGRTERALTELKSIAASADGANEAEIVMVMAHIRSGRFNDALTVLDAMERKQPGKPQAPFFRGRIEQSLGHRDKARELYEQSISRQPSYLPATMAVAALDQEDGKPAVVVSRFEKLVAADPLSANALMALISARARAGAKADDIQAQLEAAVKRFPDVDSPRLALVANLLERGEPKAALQAATEGVARFPEDPKFVEVQGLAELAAGDLNQAAQSFSKMAALQPNSVGPLMRMVDVHAARKDVPAAISQLRKVLVVKPDYLPAQVRLVTLLSRSNKMDEALALAKGIQAQSPGEPQGWTFEGDLQASKGNGAAAISAFKTSFAKRPAEETVLKLHRALIVAGQTAEADKLEADWLSKHPDASMFSLYLGDQAMSRKDFARAEPHYRRVLAIQPANVIALNNLAWLLHRSGKPGALEMSEKALALAPNSDAVLDTVAEIQAAAGHLDKALTMQRRAIQLAPEQPMHRLHLAQYLVTNGQKAQAKQELQALAELGTSFPRQDEVQKLLASL